MRLSTSMMYQRGLDGILNQQAALSRIQQQLNTGRRILSPSDDPLAAALAINVSQIASMNENYASNRASARQALGVAEDAMNAVVTTLQSVLAGLVQAGNGAMSDEDRQALVAQLTGARDELLTRANMTDGNGQYLFSGFQGTTTPYVIDPSTGIVTYNGDAGQRTIQVDQSRQMPSGAVGTAIFNQAVAGARTYISEAGSGNAGTAISSQISGHPTDPAFGSNFQIDFVDMGGGVVGYTVTTIPADGSPATTTAPAAYVSGQTINMGGASMSISGAPVIGDTFTIEQPKSGVGTNMDLFNTMNDLIIALSTGTAGDPVADAKLKNTLNTVTQKVHLNYDNVLVQRASVGARGLELDALDASGTERGLSFFKQLTDLEEVNLYQAASDFTLRKVALDAAQQVFTLLQGSSLFSRG